MNGTGLKENLMHKQFAEMDEAAKRIGEVGNRIPADAERCQCLKVCELGGIRREQVVSNVPFCVCIFVFRKKIRR